MDLWQKILITKVKIQEQNEKNRSKKKRKHQSVGDKLDTLSQAVTSLQSMMVKKGLFDSPVKKATHDTPKKKAENQER